MLVQLQLAKRIFATAACFVPFVRCVVSPAHHEVIEILGGKHAAFIKVRESPTPPAFAQIDESVEVMNTVTPVDESSTNLTMVAEAAPSEENVTHAALVQANQVPVAPGTVAAVTTVPPSTTAVAATVTSTAQPASTTSRLDSWRQCKEREALRKEVDEEILHDQLLERMEMERLNKFKAEEQALLSGIDAAKASLLVMNQASSAAKAAMASLKFEEKAVQPQTPCPPKLQDDLATRIAAELEDVVKHVQSEGSAS